MNKTWFIADPHFGHKNIIAYEKRPFASVEEMDDVLARNWNACVDRNDRIFVLGDFSFLPAKQTAQMAARLKGYKMLILGNHDRNRSVDWWRNAGFDEVSAYPILFDEFFILSHEPVYINENMPYCNIFGHVHGSPQYREFSRLHFCVSVERIDYRPIAFDKIKRLIEDVK